MIRLVIAGGGTTGHLSPGLAVAEALKARGADILFIGTPRGPEARIVPSRGFAFTPVEVIGRGRGGLTPRNVTAIAKLAGASFRCFGILRRFKPDVVLGTGGYVSLPAAFASTLTRTPLVLHEQNSVPGLANRVAERFATRVGVSFPGSEKYFSQAKLVGNPVRSEIAALDRAALRQVAVEQFDLSESKVTLLVFGGSQGARSINNAVTGAIGCWNSPDLQILHLCGTERLSETTAALEEARRASNSEIVHRVIGSTDRMDLAYASADLAVCRAGATTIAELAAVGLPAILVPLPMSLDDDQLHNAEAVVEAGGARIVLNRDLRPEVIARAVDDLILEPAELTRMSDSIRELARPDAAERMADLVVEAAGQQ